MKIVVKKIILQKNSQMQFYVGTIPIYYGCPNISEYFPEDSYYVVNINKEDCIEKIIEIINKPITQKNIDALAKARDLILNKYNIWNIIDNILIEN